MLWSAVGNKWFDSWIRKFLDFDSELDSCAAVNALTEKERKDLRSALEKINKVDQRIRKRYDKLNKK